MMQCCSCTGIAEELPVLTYDKRFDWSNRTPRFYCTRCRCSIHSIRVKIVKLFRRQVQ